VCPSLVLHAAVAVVGGEAIGQSGNRTIGTSYRECLSYIYRSVRTKAKIEAEYRQQCAGSNASQ
jgi:hypothetical protein